MISVIGKAVIELNYRVELDVDDISTDAMTLQESDKLIREAIAKKYGKDVGDVVVHGFRKVDENTIQG